MKLSELKTGEHAVIIRVTGHGGFRKRIVEMGFVKGQHVEMLLNAPLQDPVKYKIMGYEVSLRRSEASMIEVEPVSKTHAHPGDEVGTPYELLPCTEEEKIQQKHVDTSMKTINVALVGNPNCGKTSLFNFASGAHEHVGNYSGVTVEAKTGEAQFGGYTFKLTDLPGTYSLSAYSPEELFVRKQLMEHMPDVVINVIDTSNLERNLYLTTQLIDMHIRVVCALNMFDETERRGDQINYPMLSRLFGVPMIPTVFTTGRGVEELFKTIIDMVETNEDERPDYRHIHVNHGHSVEEAIDAVQKELKANPELKIHYSTRYLAIKLLEHDTDTVGIMHTVPNGKRILSTRDRAAAQIEEETGTDSETAVMDAKYGFIRGALEEAGYKTGNNKDTYHTTHTLDRFFTNRYLGFPIFFFLLWLMFECTFTLGQYPMDWIEAGVEWLGAFVSERLTDGPLKDMLIDGIIGGVGTVIVFLPQILILYLFIPIMEDSGYMARAAFIMDKLMHRMGLHGKSFIPLIMGFGCNVPAVMATRTIESRRSRLITMLVLPLMSCSARVPIYIMIIGTFFATKYQSWVMISLYLIGMVMAIIMSRLFSRYLVKGDDTPFVMELPPYRFPTTKAIIRHTWEKGKQYLKKMGGIILVASIIVWALGYFPRPDADAQLLSQELQLEQSYIGQIGKFIEPLFTPQGFDWKLDVAIISGVGAKEIVASTLGVLYSNGNLASALTPLTAYCFLLFVLLYFPCIATIAAIKGETGSWKWAAFAACYTTLLAWIVSVAVYQVGTMILS